MTPTRFALVLLALATLAGCPDSNGNGTPGGNGNGGDPFGNPWGGYDNDPTGNGGLSYTSETGPDGCPVVALEPTVWNPIYAAYVGGDDPYFHLHSTEDVLYFGAEMYTGYGPGWTGQQGTFDPDCGDNGICVYLVPDGQTVTRAVAGDVDVVSLTEVGGTLQRPAELVFRDMTFEGTEEGSDVCFHVEEVTLRAN